MFLVIPILCWLNEKLTTYNVSVAHRGFSAVEQDAIWVCLERVLILLPQE
jgi:hypothetical protein